MALEAAGIEAGVVDISCWNCLMMNMNGEPWIKPGLYIYMNNLTLLNNSSIKSEGKYREIVFATF